MTPRHEGAASERRCPQAECVPEYGLGELPPAEAAAYERHLAGCSDCARALDAFRRVAAAIRSPTGPVASPDLAERVLARLPATEPLPRVRFPSGSGTRIYVAWAATVLLLLGFSGLWLARMRTAAPDARAAHAESLAWLRQAQRADGGWAAGQDTFDVGVSGVALLALAADGRGAAGEADRTAIRRGVDFLLSRQNADGLFGPVFAAGTYNHGLATLALLEACALESNAVWRAAAERAVAYTAGIQDRSGGWSYLNQGEQAVNTSASVWPLLSLLRADALGFKGLRPRIARGLAWVRTTIGADGLMGYHRVNESPYGHKTLTAAGAFCLLKSEAGAKDPVVRAMLASVRNAAAQVGRMGEPVDFYRAFFVAQTLALAGDAGSRDARSTLNDCLLAAQNHTGTAAGSWTPNDAWSGPGGPVYATALAALAMN